MLTCAMIHFHLGRLNESTAAEYNKGNLLICSYSNNIREEVIPEDMVNEVSLRREKLIGKHLLYLDVIPP